MGEEGVGYLSVPGLVGAPGTLTYMEMIKCCGCGAGWCGWDLWGGFEKARWGVLSICRTWYRACSYPLKRNTYWCGRDLQ